MDENNAAIKAAVNLTSDVTAPESDGHALEAFLYSKLDFSSGSERLRESFI